jgi:hypothetical protein
MSKVDYYIHDEADVVHGSKEAIERTRTWQVEQLTPAM